MILLSVYVMAECCLRLTDKDMLADLIINQFISRFQHSELIWIPWQNILLQFDRTLLVHEKVVTQ